MDTTATLRRRIELAEELQTVTGTMKSLAAVTVHQYEHAVHVLTEYVRSVELALQVFLRTHPEHLPVVDGAGGARPGAGVRTMVIVLGSDRGLCGPINRHVATAARAVGDSEVPDLVVASGARVAMELEGLGMAPAEVLDVPGSAEGIGDHVQEMLLVIESWQASGPPGRVLVVHPRPHAGGRQYEPEVVPLLPIDAARLHDLARAPWPTRMLPMWRDARRDTYEVLTRQLVFVGLHRALAETQVCIHRARMAAMQGAEESIAERLDELTTQFHRQRQSSITHELLDVIAGFEAAGGPGGPGA